MSNTQKKNVPELRFPEFEGEWEEKQLGEVAKIYDGTHQTPKYTNEGIKFLSVENIKTLNSSKYISEEAFEKEFKIRPEFGDILMTRIGDIGTPNIVSSNEKFAYYVSLALLKTKNLNSYFLKNLILSSSIQNELWRKTLHVAFPKKINKNEIGKIKINYPKKQEQQKIGQFFSKLDRQIELEEQKLELLQQQKKGYMQKIFSQELRFKDENGEDYPEWEEKKIEDLMEVTSVKRIHQSDWQSSGVPFLRARDIVAYNKGEDIKEPLFISYDKYNEYSSISGKVENGDLLVTGVGTIGVPFLIKDNTPLYFKDGNIIWLKNRGILDEYFLFYSFMNANIQNYIKRVAGVGTVGTYTIANAKKTPIFEPIKLEQLNIGGFFNKIDNLIKLQAHKVEIIKQRKQGLLQKIFM
ncbi:restriction endonuclease subunit S [Staphylococcus aureus]|nr:restriction endonuclease subunit S [Staphylococcus aureus]MCM0346646.1 restriction endonuclease subunit S [Staphylococcus aureus]MCM0395277.1 restriction endonuclease subunit S [Staphylococcus aureus]MCM0397809.1 restriction endonuclease subunit S [Staphylococcus aureus]MCM0400381.1 restriction endonuclease subunit S [Staphylococcus aureus]MCM0402864.1 restriction endonuclease subunit S [Staphylococcus aureus]